jgi:4-hydroxybenzoate polyprenyltransferase
MWGNVLIGLSVAFSFSVGFLASGREDVLTARMGFLFWLVFLLGTVISLAKDIKDIDGDKQNGVVNLFTLYGEKKAKMLVSGLMFVVLSISAVLFLDPVLLLVNVVSVFFYYRRSSIIVVYLAGMINALVTFRNLYFS